MKNFSELSLDLGMAELNGSSAILPVLWNPDENLLRLAARRKKFPELPDPWLRKRSFSTQH